ncbi:MAG: ThuA domain-containing protein [Pirellulaceae bacterium]
MWQVSMIVPLKWAGLVGLLASASFVAGAEPWVVYEGQSGPGAGRHVVLVSGDEEYRSEEALPQLGKILARHHGFRCTALFAIDKKTGEINPNERSNIPGLAALEKADLLILSTRFRDLPDDQMKYLVEYIESGRPIVALRTATHAFDVRSSPTYARYTWNGKEWDGGFGRQVLGETWVSHHGRHGKESTLGLLAKDAQDHPVLRGIRDGDIWGPTDVYGVHLPLPGDSQPLVLGQVLSGMTRDAPPVEGAKNDPMMPIAWTRTYRGTAGKTARIFTTTMGSSTDLQSAGLRRLLVNATYWCLGMEDQIQPTSRVEIVGKFEPLPFGFGGFKKGVFPQDHAW